MATMVSVVLSLALYTVANWRRETENNKDRNTSFFYYHCCCEHNSMNQQSFVDISNQLTLVSLLSGFPHHKAESVGEENGQT